MASEITELKKVVAQQGELISTLSKRLNKIEKSSSNYYEEPVVEKKKEKETKRASSEKEAPTNLFRVFGIVGIILIVLGSIYFYKYAVDNGWIGITGRIAIGIISSLIIIGVGMFMNARKYESFSQILISCGLGVMYFTIFATYHFEEYRQALGMNLTLNTILCLFVMLAGALIGMKLTARWVVYGSLLLGYLAAFLSGIDGNTLHILIYVLIIDFVVLAIAKFKEWYMGIPSQILTYIAYAIWYTQGIFSPESIINQTSSPVFITMFFLFAYYLMFTLIAFVQESKNKEAETYVLSIINTICVAGFGLGIINKYYPDFNGMYLIIMAVISLIVGFISKMVKFENIFDAHFLFTCILVALAIPVQFDNTIVTVLWVVMSLGLAYAGMKTDHKRLFYTGYIAYIIPLCRVFFYDLWFLDNTWERMLAVISVLVGLLIIQIVANMFLRNRNETNAACNIYSGVSAVLIPIWIAREIYDLENMGYQMKHVLVSVSWAVLSIIMIIYGVTNRRKLFNICGIILFGVVVLKVLIVDLSALGNIYRVLALVITGIIALVGSFIFVKNKDRLKDFV